MDAGGLAQMSYNNFPSSNGLGMPGSGFASRRANGSNIKRLSFEPPKPSDPQDNGAPTPRTSRSHLLAGLRTAPKSATSSTFPSTAPATQLQHNVGLAGSMYADNKENYGGAQTSHYSNQQLGYGQMNGNRQMYSVPEQILAPPEIHVDEHSQEQMDPNLYAQLVATNMYLAEQQQRLQQQLMNVQAAAQQFQGLNLGGNQMQQQFATPPITPQNMYQQQQVKNNMQPIITPVAGAQPGIYSYYNPMTGQQTYFMDQSAQQNQYMDQQTVHQQVNYSPPQKNNTPRFQVSPPPPLDTSFIRSTSPPKKAVSPPQDHAPLPPPSAGAFRRGHRKATSMAIGTDLPISIEGPKSALLPKSMGFPQTPTAFGPGQGRAGEHPIRQPRGPPPLDELKAKPTTKFEGSKNFATRTRRNAVHNLVRAGMERRRAPGSAGSGSMSPVSEAGEVTFSVSSDNDSDSGRSGSGSLSGRPTLGSPRTSVHGAIGSDRPSSRQKARSLERKSVASLDSSFTTSSVSSDEGSSVGGSFAAVFKNGGKKLEASESERKAPMLVLSSAEKRKSSIY